MSDPGLEEKPLQLAPLAPGRTLRARVLEAAREEAEVAARLERGERLARLWSLYDRWLEPLGALLLGALQLGSAVAMVLR
jgi:hypothetical protein